MAKRFLVWFIIWIAKRLGYSAQEFKDLVERYG
jgi:hypothetical protein